MKKYTWDIIDFAMTHKGMPGDTQFYLVDKVDVEISNYQDVIKELGEEGLRYKKGHLSICRIHNQGVGWKCDCGYGEYIAKLEELAKEDTVTVVFQINGKIRAREELPTGLAKAELENRALEHPRIKELLAGKNPDKVIAVVDKLVNLVVRSA